MIPFGGCSSDMKNTNNAILVVDYGMGNLRSVSKALEKAGAKVKISSAPKDILRADKLVLPGVGAFKDAMAELKSRRLIKPIKKFVETGKPFLGLCLGLQLIFSKSEEGRSPSKGQGPAAAGQGPARAGQGPAAHGPATAGAGRGAGRGETHDRRGAGKYNSRDSRAYTGGRQIQKSWPGCNRRAA